MAAFTAYALRDTGTSFDTFLISLNSSDANYDFIKFTSVVHADNSVIYNDGASVGAPAVGGTLIAYFDIYEIFS